MKKAFVIFIFLLCAICSCTKITYQWEWEPISMSQSEVIVNANGGTCMIECNNYHEWTICSITDTATGKCYRTDSEGIYNFWDISGNGIRAQVGERKNTVEITVGPSSDQKTWIVAMAAGDAFSDIIVKQNKLVQQ